MEQPDFDHADHRHRIDGYPPDVFGDLPPDSRRAYPRDADQAGGDFGRHEKQQQPAAVGFEHVAQQYRRNQSLCGQID